MSNGDLGIPSDHAHSHGPVVHLGIQWFRFCGDDLRWHFALVFYPLVFCPSLSAFVWFVSLANTHNYGLFFWQTKRKSLAVFTTSFLCMFNSRHLPRNRIVKVAGQIGRSSGLNPKMEPNKANKEFGNLNLFIPIPLLVAGINVI